MPKFSRPAVADVTAALKAYYGCGHIGNDQIRDIFGITGSSTIARLKKPVRDAEAKEGVPVAVPYKVNTRIAFKVWGIDVAELEKNRKKAEELGL